MDLSAYTIIVSSNEPWGDVWLTKQHFANELAKLGASVYFLNPVSKWGIGDLFSSQVEIIETPFGIKVVNYRNPYLYACCQSFSPSLMIG